MVNAEVCMMRKEDETRRRRRIGKRRRERESITGVGGPTPVPDLKVTALCCSRIIPAEALRRPRQRLDAGP